MPAPVETIPGCPPGLEYLTQIDQLLVHQQVELFEGKDGVTQWYCLLKGFYSWTVYMAILV